MEENQYKNRNFNCIICTKFFFSHYNLRRHLKNVHGIGPDAYKSLKSLHAQGHDAYLAFKSLCAQGQCNLKKIKTVQSQEHNNLKELKTVDAQEHNNLKELKTVDAQEHYNLKELKTVDTQGHSTLKEAEILKEFADFSGLPFQVQPSRMCFQSLIVANDSPSHPPVPGKKMPALLISVPENKGNVSSLIPSSTEKIRQKELEPNFPLFSLSNIKQEAPDDEQNLSPVPQISSVQTCSEHQNNPVHSTPQNTNITDLISKKFPLFSLSNIKQEVLDDEQNLSPITQISSVQTCSDHQNNPVHSTPQNTNNTDLISSVPQDITSSQIPLSFVAVESPSNVKQISSKHPNDPMLRIPEDTNTIQIVSVASQYINSSQLPLISANVKDNCEQPFDKNAVERSSAAQAVSNNDRFTLLVVPSSDTNTLPVISNSATDSLPKISSAKCSSSLVVSTSVKGTSTQEVFCTHSSIATQTNFDENTQEERVPHCSIGTQTNFDENTREERVLHCSVATQMDPVHHCSVATQMDPVHQCSVATQMNFHALKTPKKILKYQMRFAKTLEHLPKVARVKGRRIVDFRYFFKAIIDVNNHSKDINNHSEAGCDLNNIFIKKEKKYGLCTSYFLKCAVCDFKKRIWSENPKSLKRKKNLNTDFLSGILSIECSFEDVNALLSKMRLPLLSANDFVKGYEKVYAPLSKVDINKTLQNTSKNLVENVQREPQLSDMQECSSESESSDFLENVDLGGLFVEDQFETNEECVEPETISLDQKSRTSLGGLFVEDQFESNEECVEPETISLDQRVRTSLGTLFVEDQFESNEENVEPETINLDQRVRTSDDKLIADQEQVILNMTTIKQEINSDDDDLTSSVNNETTSKESTIDNYDQSILRTVLSQQNEERVCKNRTIVNQEPINLHKNDLIINSNVNNILVKPEIDVMEITDEESATDFDYKLESELPRKKARIEIYKD